MLFCVVGGRWRVFMIGECVRSIFWLDGAGWTFSYGLARMGGGIFWVVGVKWRYILCEETLFIGE